MTALCMVLGGSDAQRGATFDKLVATQRYHGAVHTVLDRPGIRAGVCARPSEISVFEDDGIAVLVTGYLVELGSDGHLHGLAGASPAQWLAGRWLRLGPNALEAVDGDYAAVVLDKRDRRIHAIAGPTVIYPLFIARSPGDRGQWVIGAEPLAVLRAAGLTPEMNTEAIAQHLFYLGTLLEPTATPFQGVMRIPAGSRACWSMAAPQQFELHTFWRPEGVEPRPGRPREELLQGLRGAIEESVLHALPPSGSSTLALSGGMDSSSIWAVIRQAAGQGDERAKGVRSYSFIYPGTPSDEQPFIDENHRYWGTVGCYRDIAGEHINDSDAYLLSQQDYPLSGSTTYALMLLAEDLAAGQTDTLMAGFSGDFWLNVPWAYQSDLLRRGQIAAALSPLTAAWQGGQIGFPGALRWLAGIVMPRGSLARRLLRPVGLPQGMGRQYRHLSAAVEQWYAERVARHGHARAQMLYARETQWASCAIPLTLVQLLSRRGMALRDPLGSRRLMEWALSVPAHEMAGPLEKAFMREALHELLPPRVRDKDFPTFHGGDRSRRHDVFRDLGDPRQWLLCQSGLVDVAHLRECWKADAHHYDLQLERLAMTEAYCRRHFT